MAKLKVVPPPPPEEEPEQEECPKCPPVGAPAWMATFADMATLLMAFFVLILSFAEFNQPRFKMIAGSLRESFGVQRLVPVVESPKGTTVISQTFSPSPQPSVTQEMTQDTTQQDQREVKTDEPTENTEKETDPQEQTDQQTEEQQQEQQEKQQLMEELQDALEGTDLSVEMQGDQVTVTFPEASSDQPMAERAEQMQQLADALEQTGATGEDVQVSGLANDLGRIADAMGGAGEGTGTGDSQAAQRRAGVAEAKLEVALQEQIDQGLVAVEREEDKIFVTVGAGGAFSSGSADLTAEAQEIMRRLALSAAGNEGTITVTGHTDDVPLSGGQFTDNWGLASGRASAVVRELGATGLISPDRLSAVSKGESEPVASNDTPEGREQNRRIEIEIDF